MLFEFSIARKYLSPRKNQLSVSLIALMSVMVISVVVWLVVVFLSVTEGIERSWLEKLTSLNGPIKIQPTPKYFSSYYYQIDQHSLSSGYGLKNIKQKAHALSSDPYNPETDEELPLSFPKPDLNADGTLKDPVKKAYKILSKLQEKVPDLAFQDFEVSGALLRLQLLRNNGNHSSYNFLTQVSYLVSFTEQNPHMHSLLIPPAAKDLNHLLFLANKKWDHVCEDIPTDSKDEPLILKNVLSILKNSHIEEMKTSAQLWKLPLSILPENGTFEAYAAVIQDQITHFILPANRSQNALSESLQRGVLVITEKALFFTNLDKNEKVLLTRSTPVFVEGPLKFQSQILEKSLYGARSFSDIHFKVKTVVQNQKLSGEIPWEGIEISKAEITNHFEATPEFIPPWPYILEKAKKGLTLPKNDQNATPIFLARTFQDNGVVVGDRGYLSYPSMTASGLQEQRFSTYVAGFYDAGIMSMSNKYILVPPKVTSSINASSSPYSVDPILSNGITLWFSSLKDCEKIKADLQKSLKEEGIDSYWKVSTYKEYDFAKDLLQQFQSDKYLFTLIGIIVLVVACSNIISMLILLVQNKKREIGILQAMGASKKSIALIFGICGTFIGIMSSLIGIALALLTLHNIDFVVKLLSALQGHEAFNALFFGKSLPNELSKEALYFVLISTPVISLLAGLIPAIKACNLRPSQILRSE